MKKLFYILLALTPLCLCAQKSWYKSSLSEYSWQNVGNPGFSAAEADYTSLAFNQSGEPYVAFQDWDKAKKATVMKFNGTDWVNVGVTGFSELGAYGTNLVISPSGEPYVAYDDISVFGSTVMKYNGLNWIYVGHAGIYEGGGETEQTKLAFSPTDGFPYIVFQEAHYTGKGVVMKYDGANWVTVGTSLFTAGTLLEPDIAFNPTGDLYVAYSDGANEQKATVMKFNDTGWTIVGTAGFSTGSIMFTSLAFSPSGEPYVAYQDVALSMKATVMKFNGTTWVNVGTAGFSDGQADYISLVFNPTDGKPYVAYTDYTNYEGATVKKFDGTDWTTVGTAGFSVGHALYTSLGFSPTGQAHVAFSYGEASNKATVMKYDSVYNWINEPRISQLLIYPNPASDNLTIETTTIQTRTKLFILNVNGQELISSQITEPKTVIDISKLPSGVYFVRVINDNLVNVRKIIKQ